MINLISTNIEGFGSIKSLFYRLDQKGLNMISGPNGSGKSTILNAVYWAIYGKKLKEKSSVLTWEDRRDKDYAGAKVELTFIKGKKEYRIVRLDSYTKKFEGSKKKNRLLLYKNGKLSTKLGKSEVQAQIEKIIKMSPTLFKHSIIFGQSLTRLMSTSGPEQKKLFDEALDTSFINDAKEEANKDYQELLETLNEYETSTSNLEDSLNTIKEALDNNDRYKKNFYEAQKEKVDKLTTKVKESIKNLKKLKTKQKKYNKVAPLIEDLNSKIEFTEAKIDKAEADQGRLEDLEYSYKDIIDKIGSLRKNKCPECGSPVKDETAKQKVIELTEAGEKITNKITQIKSSQSSILELRKTYKNLLSKLEKYNIHKDYSSDIKWVKREYKNLIVRRSELIEEQFKDESKALRKKYKKIKLEIKKIKIKSKALTKKTPIYNWLIGEALSNKGLKAFIFHAMLGKINKGLEKYSKDLPFTPVFIVDLDSGNKNFEIHLLEGEELRDYNDLSGGQKQLVDILLAIAIHDLVRAENKINCIFMDEVFESLDESNIDIISNILDEYSKDKALHIITHRTEFNISPKNRLQLQLTDGAGTIVL